MTLPYRAYGKPTLNDSFAANQVFRQAERIPESSDSGILFFVERSKVGISAGLLWQR